MRLFLVSLAAAIGICACGTSVVAKSNAVPLKIDTVIDTPVQAATVNDQQIRMVVFKLQRSVARPLSGKIVIDYPSVLEPKGKTETLNFNFSKGNTEDVNTKIAIPAGTKIGQYTFPVKVLIGDKKYVDMDLIVSKSVGWSYVGPFDGGPETSHNKVFEPETKIDLNSSCIGRSGKQVCWKPFPNSAICDDGMYGFHNIWPAMNYATAYATTNVYVDKDTKARLLVGSDDSVKVWLNGKVVDDQNVLRASSPGDDKVAINLNKGKNTFLVKVCQAEDAWGFHFDIDDGNGKPIDGLKRDIVVSRGSIADPVLRLSEVTRTGASITWKSDVTTTSKVIVRVAQPGRALPVFGDTPKSEMVKPAEGVTPLVFEDNNYTCDHKFSFKGLKPGTRYLVSVTPAIEGKESEAMSFYTAAPKGKMEYLKLRHAVVIFTNVVPEKFASVPGADKAASQAMVDQLKAQCEEATMFYWINTGMRYYCQNDYYVVNKFIVDSDDSAYGVGYDKGAPDEKAYAEVLAANGKKLSDYDHRVFITVEKRWDENSKKWWLPASGGGTIGPEYDPGYGKSAWKAGSPNAWMYSHECGHAYDALYNWSMGPEMIFNHPQPWDGTAHRTGDHYDVNAYIMWDWAGYVNDQHQGRPFLKPTKWFRYFENRWGEVVLADDKDGDGVPDNDPNCPLDEVRWKSDPTKKDTDNDGLDDLQEAMATEWVDYGNGEIWGGPLAKHRCDPRNPDTDGDGIPDGKDPYPIYAVDPNVKEHTPILDGKVTDGEYAPFATLDDEAIKMDFHLAWDKDYLYISGKSKTAPNEVKILLDMGDNGWYMGHDNYHLVVHPDGGMRAGAEWHCNADKSFGAAFHNCGVPGKWPFYDPAGLKDGEVKFAQSKDNGYSFEIAIPRNHDNGVDLIKGQKIGVVFGVLPTADFVRHWQHAPLTVFECHSRYTFTLAGK